MILAMIANTMSEMHSWSTFSWTSEKGPPLPANPMRLAGTWQQYSKNAMNHENMMTPNSGQFEDTPDCCKRRCPYQANVIKMLLSTSSMMVYRAFITLDAVKDELNQRVDGVFVLRVHLLGIAVGDDHATGHGSVPKQGSKSGER